MIGTSYYETARKRVSVLSGKEITNNTENQYPIYQIMDKLNKWSFQRKEAEIEYAQRSMKLFLFPSNKLMYDEYINNIEKLLIMNKCNQALSMLNQVIFYFVPILHRK